MEDTWVKTNRWTNNMNKQPNQPANKHCKNNHLVSWHCFFKNNNIIIIIVAILPSHYPFYIYIYFFLLVVNEPSPAISWPSWQTNCLPSKLVEWPLVWVWWWHTTYTDSRYCSKPKACKISGDKWKTFLLSFSFW